MDQLERANRRAALDLRDKEELIRALTSRLELAQLARGESSARDAANAAAAESGDVSLSEPTGSLLAESRAKAAELTGANAALRSRCQELDGEAKAARDEAAGLRRRVAALAADKAPTLVDLVAQAVAEGRARVRAQSLKALRVLEAKDAVLASREREVAEARAESGAAQSTLAATPRVDSCERRLVATLEEQGKLRAEAASLAESRDGAERRARDTVTALKAEIDALVESSRDDAENAARAAEMDEERAFLRAAAESASAALDAAKAECSGCAAVAAERGGAARRRAHAARRARRCRRARARRARARRGRQAPRARRCAPPSSGARSAPWRRRWSRRAATRSDRRGGARRGGAENGCARPETAERREAASAPAPPRRRGPA